MYSVEEVADSVPRAGWDEAFRALHGAHDAVTSARKATTRPRLVWQGSDRYRLAWCAGAAQSVSRGSKHVRTDPRGTYELLIPLRGRAVVSSNGEAVELTQGGAALCDLDRPLRLSHGAEFESISLVVPQTEVVSRERALTGAATLIDTTKGLGALVRQLAVSLHSERLHLDQRAFDASCDGLLDLAALAAGGAGTAPQANRASVADSVRDFVRAHAHEADLDVHRIARSLGWSTRHVQSVLQSSGTTARDLIRVQRLELARTRLRSDQWSDVTVADIASACGFSTHSSFATAFRVEYGVTPSAVRETGAEPRTALDVA